MTQDSQRICNIYMLPEQKDRDPDLNRKGLKILKD